VSEYQYYEFQAIDRPLTEEEQRAVARLSSRVDPHPWRAVFTYSWSDFPGRAKEMLAAYYDAMLYMANWGSRQLVFRFPKSLVDLERVQAYCQPLFVQEYISFSTVDEYVLLEFHFRDEERGDWIEGEGWLASLVGLRDDMLRRDYRALYLSWLKTLEIEDVLDSVVEPPVPPGLEKLSPALRTFVDFFEVDEFLIQVAAEGSRRSKAASEGDLRRAIAELAPEERDAFLLRLAKGEPHLSVALNRRLGAFLDVPQRDDNAGRRTVGELFAAAETLRERLRKESAARAEAKRIAELKALAQREDETWREVDALIQQSKARAYQEATRLLVKLRELAIYEGQEMVFQQQLNRIYEQYTRRSALLRRLQEAGLYPL